MNFAVIPWSKNELNDYIFYSIDDRGKKYRLQQLHILCKKSLKDLDM